jgi:myo-inositol 2-dehydrogenase/D-chiro-inositol 1-dehydrogenase
VPIGIAVFGAGRIGAVHARNIACHENARLAGIADIDRAASAALAAVTAGRVDTVENFLADPGVDAVAIATPTGTHVELIRQAAAAKKHIFCEKPISMDVRTTIEAAEAARKAGVILQIGFQRRFDRDFLRAREAIDSGELGEVRYMRLVGRDRTLPPIEYLRTSGGQYKDQMIHDFDAARWFMQPQEVHEVQATGSALADPRVAEAGDVDTAVACLRFSNGAIAVVEAAREAAYGYDTRTELHGSRGLLLNGYEGFKNGQILDASLLSQHNDSFVTRFADAYRLEIDDFIDAVQSGRAPRVGAGDALQALRIAIAADRSWHSGRAVKLVDVEGA